MDSATIELPNGELCRVAAMEPGADDTLWHVLEGPVPALPPDAKLTVLVDAARRMALSRHHTALHIVNTIALRDYGAWITGAQIGEEYSRIDFKIEAYTAAILADLSEKVNRVVSANHTTRAFCLEQAAFEQRPDLLRTLEVRPPVRDGMVRVVAIEGFDEQACGGTHARSTRELGTFEIFKTENKGKVNKRLYVRLSPP